MSCCSWCALSGSSPLRHLLGALAAVLYPRCFCRAASYSAVLRSSFLRFSRRSASRPCRGRPLVRHAVRFQQLAGMLTCREHLRETPDLPRSPFHGMDT